MACGGSNFGIALDNCVSIQPEVANPTWVIERMVCKVSWDLFCLANYGQPSKRVMSLMVALPDGTFFIAGGAHRESNLLINELLDSDPFNRGCCRIRSRKRSQLQRDPLRSHSTT